MHFSWWLFFCLSWKISPWLTTKSEWSEWEWIMDAYEEWEFVKVNNGNKYDLFFSQTDRQTDDKNKFFITKVFYSFFNLIFLSIKMILSIKIVWGGLCFRFVHSISHSFIHSFIHCSFMFLPIIYEQFDYSLRSIDRRNGWLTAYASLCLSVCLSVYVCVRLSDYE